MKMIEIEAHGKSYIINPVQIKFAEGKMDGDKSTLILRFAGEEASVFLRFTGQEALDVFTELQNVGY